MRKAAVAKKPVKKAKKGRVKIKPRAAAKRAPVEKARKGVVAGKALVQLKKENAGEKGGYTKLLHRAQVEAKPPASTGKLMHISDLRPGMSRVTVAGEVIDLPPPKYVLNRYRQSIKLVDATIKDGSGEITLTAWEADVDKLKLGAKVRVNEGYVSEFLGIRKLSCGKHGAIEVL